MAVRSLDPVPGAPHGTSGGYTNWGCGCVDCKAAFAAWQKGARRRRQQNLDAADVEHGTSSTYTNHGCRCQACTDAHTSYRAKWPKSRSPADSP